MILIVPNNDNTRLRWLQYPSCLAKKLYLSFIYAISLVCCLPATSSAQTNDWAQLFKDPPVQYRPMPFWHLNGQLSDKVIDRQMSDVKNASGFGGVTVLPVSAGTVVGAKKPTRTPGTSPKYLSADYFKFYGHILQDAKDLGLKVIWYDDLDFPSGSAGGLFKKTYPGDVRKILLRKDSLMRGNTEATMEVPPGKLMSAIAMDTSTKKMIDLRSFVIGRQLKWAPPGGTWKVMAFACDTMSTKRGEENMWVDYLDPQAVQKYVDLNHEQFATRFRSYFGTTVNRIFFDDVGFITPKKYGERMWTTGFNEKFRSLYGTDPAMLYPALWEDIGEQTIPARIALWNTRAELLSEGFPKIVTEWCDRYGLQSMGHPPGNYDIQPVDMNGDVFKFYRYQRIPLIDLIFYHGHGRDGYKLISSAGNLYDRDIVAAEIYGAIGVGVGGSLGKAQFTTKILYQAAMEVFTRGINFLVPHGMWLNPDSNAVRIKPLISAYSKEIGPELPQYNAWAGRCCMLLQGGRTVTDIAVLYPINSLEAWFTIGMNKAWGSSVAPGTDYLQISEILTNQVHRDFTFIHPESLDDHKIEIENNELVLQNAINRQSYKTLIMPGGDVISVKTLKLVKQFYDNGGNIIATSLLPTRSAELGMNAEVQTLVKELFSDTTRINVNTRNGHAVFIPNPTATTITQMLQKMKVSADVTFDGNPQPLSANGMLSYIHKVKDGKDIYFFANSTDEKVNTRIKLRGKVVPQLWNPYDGTTKLIDDVKYISEDGNIYTSIPFSLNAVRSIFIVASRPAM